MSGRTYILLYALILAILNGFVKYLDRLPAHEIILMRNLIMGSLTFMSLRKAKIPYWGHNKKMLIFRGISGVIFVIFFYEALQRMPLGSATAVHYMFPIFAVVLASIFLKEPANLSQWFFFGLSFCGVLLIKEFDPRVSLLGLSMAIISAIAVAVVMITIRSLRDEEHPLVVMFYLPVMGLLILGPYTLTHWIKPTSLEWFILILCGFLSQVVQFCLTLAYSKESVAKIGNLNYLTVVYSLIIGIVFFKETIEPLAIAGIAIIIVASIFSSVKTKTA